jgi:hypothetical protein
MFIIMICEPTSIFVLFIKLKPLPIHRFVSDCMGHPPLIPDHSYTTKFPADVDDDLFGPASARLPVPAGEGYGTDGFKYFEVKCRCVFLSPALPFPFTYTLRIDWRNSLNLSRDARHSQASRTNPTDTDTPSTKLRHARARCDSGSLTSHPRTS